MPNKVNMNLVGLDGNAFSLMGAFKREAQKQGWTSEEIKQVLDKCMKGDYDHLLNTLMDNITDLDESDNDDYEFEEDRV